MLDLFQKPRIHKLCSVMQYNLFHLSNLEVCKMLFILHCHTQQHFTVWKLENFSVTQILRETKHTENRS